MLVLYGKEVNGQCIWRVDYIDYVISFFYLIFVLYLRPKFNYVDFFFDKKNSKERLTHKLNNRDWSIYLEVKIYSQIEMLHKIKHNKFQNASILSSQN
jgi:hypothetical protein